MKKSLLTIAAAAVFAFGFTSCDMNLDDLLNDPELNLTGSITLTTTSPQGTPQAYGQNDTIRFKSAACNITEAVQDTFGVTTNAGTVMVGTFDNLLTSNNSQANLSFPLVGINLRGTSAQNYTVDCPVNDLGFFQYLHDTDVNLLITRGIMYANCIGSLFAVAVSDTAYYIGYDGNINITNFGPEGDVVEGTVNVTALYVTKGEIERIANDADYRATIGNFATHFPSITFNGNIASRRLPIEAVIDALEENTK